MPIFSSEFKSLIFFLNIMYLEQNTLKILNNY